MKWSWKIARVAGIDVYIHATFLLIIGWVALNHWSQGLAGMISGLLFILAMFACVVLHEFGHALTARRYSIKTERVEHTAMAALRLLMRAALVLQAQPRPPRHALPGLDLCDLRWGEHPIAKDRPIAQCTREVMVNTLPSRTKDQTKHYEHTRNQGRLEHHQRQAETEVGQAHG